MTNLKELLESVKGITKENADGKFYAIAKELFNNYEIQKGDKHYGFLEIEFYYYTKDHEDIITYPREVGAGKWFFHNSGVDISFESKWKEKDIWKGKEYQSYKTRKPDEDFFGGILIRSLLKNNNEVITGPLKCTWDLFDVIDALKVISEDLPVITKKKETSIKEVHRTSRYISINDEKANQKFGVNYDDFKLFKEKNYHYYIKR